MCNLGRVLTVLVLAVVVASFSPGASAAGRAALPAFRFQVSEIGNLVYQLDCLTERKPCAFEDLWKKRLGWTADDDGVLAERKRLKGGYKGSAVIGDVGDDGALMADYPRRLSVRRKIMRAAFGARDLVDYQHRLEMVILPADAVELTRMTARFLPRFQVFWREARPRLEANRRAFQGFMRRPDLRRLLEQTVAFFEISNPGDHRADFPLLAIPPEWTGRTSGEQFENQTLLEVEAGESPRSHFAIAMHEAFHYFYSVGSPEQTRRLVAGFAAADDPGAANAFGLLSEVMPSVLSAGMVHQLIDPPAEYQKARITPGTYYQIPAVDDVAKALVPWMEDRLKRGLGFYEASFVPGYLQVARQALGPKLDRPALGRVVPAGLEHPTLQPALDLIVSQARPVRQETSPLADRDVRELLEQHPQQGGYVMVRADRLGQLMDWEKVLGSGALGDLRALARKQKAFVRGVRRPSATGKPGMVYVFVAQQPAEFEALARKFVEAPAPFELLTL
jgi:hypothetical protein